MHMKAHLSLIKHSLNNGCRIAVYVDGSLELQASFDYSKIKEASECADECSLAILRGPKGNLEFRESALIIHDGGDDTVSDYSVPSAPWKKGFIDAWFDRYLAA